MQQMFPCPNCGWQSYVGQQFCSNCGQVFSYNCPYCSAIVDPTFAACPNCHVLLNWPTQQEQPYQQQQAGYGYGGETPVQEKKSPWLMISLVVAVVAIVAGGIIFAVVDNMSQGSTSVPGGVTDNVSGQT